MDEEKPERPMPKRQTSDELIAEHEDRIKRLARQASITQDDEGSPGWNN